MAAVQQQKVVVVVDPYSSGLYLVQELASQQWPVVGIQSSQDLAGFWLAQYDRNRYVHTICHKDLQQTRAELDAFEVVAVFAGSEPGVLLAEELAEALDLPCNGAATKEWRRDKYAQQERLRECGIRAIKQLYSGDLEEILAWREQWGKWPVIVKPAMSGGTDGVYWCHCDDDIKLAHAEECGKRNVNGVVNDQLLVQEYLDGPEYILDAVSHEGRHVLSGIWIHEKLKNPVTKGISSEYARIIESTGPEQEKLISYAWQCLDALCIKYGPSHSEFIFTSDGPCLIETGARLHGVKGPKLIELATGLGTHELAVDIAVNGARIFNDLHAKGHRYTIKRFAFETALRNDHAVGRLAEPIDVPELRGLASVYDLFPSVRVGDELAITRDLATAPGFVMQLHASLERCLSDFARIRELEAGSLYKVLPPSSDDATARPPSPRETSGSFSVMSPMQAPKEPGSSGPNLKASADGAEVAFELDGMEPNDLK